MAFWARAREWDSRMRNRHRWIADEQLRAEVADLSRKHLEEWTVGESSVIALARAGVVEVFEDKSPPGSDYQTVLGLWGIASCADAWYVDTARRDLRRMPWESLLTMAARKYQNREKLMVYRRLGGLGDRKNSFVSRNLTGLFVESAPGALWKVHTFGLELRSVQTYLRGVPVERQQNLTLAELTEYVKRHSPAVIHVSAIDGYQGFSVLPQADEAARPQDGVYFRDESGEPKVETAEAVAAALCAAGAKPLLVTFNLNNSSARLAAETVTRGAAAAIGFQDFMDHTVAEIFFANLFQAWTLKPGTPLLEAFRAAVEELAPYTDRVRGSGVALWTSERLLEEPDALCLPPAKGNSRQAPVDLKVDLKIDLEFDVTPCQKLNYSVLHNRHRMFDSFRIYKFGGGERTDVRVEVNLNVNGQNFPFRQSYSMKHHILDLTEGIAVGLTSSLSRSLRESVRTTIFVRVTVGPDDERYCRTFDVSLLAVDEWIDDDISGIFLPSFVLPRDPIIPEVIDKAQRYLMAIADDANQGFDGYQSCPDPCDDPGAVLAPQTRAIWCALQYDFAVKYINPPPTFTESSQRLRSPSEILKGGRGTCIDLALLLAACYEEIGLDAVVFLLSGHCFAGYWADEKGRDQLRTTTSDSDSLSVMDPAAIAEWMKTSPEELAAENGMAPVVWKYEARRQVEVQAAVKKGALVAVEATYLTNGSSFASACEQGANNLDPSSDEAFDSMLDVSLARDNDVTPLPMAE